MLDAIDEGRTTEGEPGVQGADRQPAVRRKKMNDLGALYILHRRRPHLCFNRKTFPGNPDRGQISRQHNPYFKWPAQALQLTSAPQGKIW